MPRTSDSRTVSCSRTALGHLLSVDEVAEFPSPRCTSGATRATNRSRHRATLRSRRGLSRVTRIRLRLLLTSRPAMRSADPGAALSTKVHQLVDRRECPLVIGVKAGQAADSPMLKHPLADLAVNRAATRPGPGRPRSRPQMLLGDKAYSSRANRLLLRSKRVRAVIPQANDQIAYRKQRGTAGGRPPAFDPVINKRRNVVERSFCHQKQWRGIATRYELATSYRGGVVLRAIVHLATGITRHALADPIRHWSHAHQRAAPRPTGQRSSARLHVS